jgi:hypothetical protein
MRDYRSIRDMHKNYKPERDVDQLVFWGCVVLLLILVGVQVWKSSTY